MKRIILILAAAALFGVANSSAAVGLAPKPLPKPVCFIGPVNVVAGRVLLQGSCRYGRKVAAASWHWLILGETDASSAPLPAQLANGTGSSIPLPPIDGYQLQLKLKLSTSKTITHQAATRTVTLGVTLGSYNSIGTAVPALTGWDSGYPYCHWNQLLTVGDGQPTAHGPSSFGCPAVMGQCQWQALPASPPTDVVPNRDGTVTTTGLTVYGGHVVCSSGYVSVSRLVVAFAYFNGDQLTDSCELPLAGVTSFTVPPSWGGSISFTADLLTFGPDGKLYNANQFTNAPPYQVRTSGTLEVCQAYHLPPINTSDINP